MIHISRVFLPCVLLALLAAPAAGQGFKWWQAEEYRSELGLTAEQSSRIEEIFQAAVPTLQARKRLLDHAENAFDRLFEQGDDGAVMEQVSKVEAARAELNKERTMMLLRMKRALTKDQWAKFTALQQAAERQRHHQSQRTK